MHSTPPLSEELAMREIEQGTVRVDLWEQAIASSQGNKAKARSTYIRLRTQSIQSDIGKLLTQHIRAAVAKDSKRPKDFKSARDIPPK